MNAQQYFLKYAFPCAFVLLQQKKISDAEYKDLKKSFDNNETVSKEILEKLFPSAFRRIRIIAERECKKGRINDYWDIEIIKKYFMSQEHNMFIDNNDGDYKYFPESFKELCRIHVGEVIDRDKDKATGEDVLTVEYFDKKKRLEKRKVIGKLVPDANIGDKVTIHFAFAVEKVE